MSHSPAVGVGSGESGMYEVRLYGLHGSITRESLTSFFANGVRVLGVQIHPANDLENHQWAQVWTGSESEVEICLNLRNTFSENGITVERSPTSAPPGWLTPESKYNLGDHPPPFTHNQQHLRLPLTPPISHTRGMRPGNMSSLGYRHVDPHGPLPRNLYVMGLPLDMTQVLFKSIFTPYGMVEHSTLLSQLDGMGRRRGFVLMSTHREAVAAMQGEGGRYVDGAKLDVSWALVQREAKNFAANAGMVALPNRVIHPPAIAPKREPNMECSVIVENLDPSYFPNAGMIREIFTYFGPVLRVTVLPASLPTNPFSDAGLQALIQFEHPVSAVALITSNGMSLGGRRIHTKAFGVGSITNLGETRFNTPFQQPITRATPTPTPTPKPRWEFDPFATEYITPLQDRATGLSAASRPFFPASSSSNQNPPQQKSSSPNSGLGSSMTNSELSKGSFGRYRGHGE